MDGASRPIARVGVPTRARARSDAEATTTRVARRRGERAVAGDGASRARARRWSAGWARRGRARARAVAEEAKTALKRVALRRIRAWTRLRACSRRVKRDCGNFSALAPGTRVVARVLHLESALGNGRNAPRAFWKSRVLFIHQVLRESASLSTRSVAVHALYRALEDICEEDSLFCAPHDADAETVIKEILDSDEFNDWCHADEIRALDPSPSPFVEAGKGGALANLRRVWLMRRMLGMPEIERFKARTLDAARTLFSVFVGEDDLFERFTRYWIRVHARGEDVRERRLDSWSVDVDVDAARLWLTCCAEQFGDHAEQAKIWGIDYIHQ